jgi:hypothetical protein
VQLVIVIIQALVIWGGTYVIYTVDRNRRRAQGGLSMTDPETKTLMLLNILLNIACLPYYFKRTRGTTQGLFIGIGFFLALLVASIVVGVIGRVVPTLAS